MYERVQVEYYKELVAQENLVLVPDESEINGEIKSLDHVPKTQCSKEKWRREAVPTGGDVASRWPSGVHSFFSLLLLLPSLLFAFFNLPL